MYGRETAMCQHRRLWAISVWITGSMVLALSANAVEVGKGAVISARSGAAAVARPAAGAGTLREGVLTRVDVPGGKVEIDGQWHSLIWGHTQVFQQGHSARPEVLRVGQLVRYTAAAAHGAGKRIGVIYAP
jgi:hypothetical protein